MNGGQRNSIWIGSAALGLWALTGIEVAKMNTNQPNTTLYFGLAAIICIITAAITYSLSENTQNKQKDN